MGTAWGQQLVPKAREAAVGALYLTCFASLLDGFTMSRNLLAKPVGFASYRNQRCCDSAEALEHRKGTQTNVPYKL